jgi:PLP dependent protein
MSVTESISKYNLELGDVELIAVSKTKPISAIMEAYEAGQRHFGENKIQELAAKYVELPKDIQWHMIGTVQTNKIKYIAPFVHMVHGVDRRKVLVELNKQAVKCSRTIKSLLQVQIASEDTKSGLSEGELRELVGQLDDFPNAEVVGLMGMATNTKDMNLVNSEFARLKDLYDELGTTRNWNTLSMGMSGDYKLAIENGSTHVRIGSSIFGARND